MLPTWLQSKRPAEEQEAEAQPKSKSRFQVDLKARKLDQFKTFLEPEEVVRPINPLADYIPIEKVANGIIYTRDHRYVKLVEVVPVNFLLRSAREQRSIIYSFISYLKIAPVKVQFKVLTKRADINRHMDTVRRELTQETDERCRQASNEKPFPQKVKEVLAEYMVAGRLLDTIPSNDFYAPSHIDLNHGRYICIDGVYYAYLLVLSNGYKPKFPPAGCPCWSTPGTGSTWICFSPASPRTG